MKTQVYTTELSISIRNEIGSLPLQIIQQQKYSSYKQNLGTSTTKIVRWLQKTCLTVNASHSKRFSDDKASINSNIFHNSCVIVV